MAMVLKYRGDIYSLRGNKWSVEILQESDSTLAVGELTFAGDKPLIIEYKKKEKYEVICSSTATLTILSPGDRTFLDLYSIKAGQIRLDVYRNGLLYWSGCLDPEFYSEPYSREKNYEVSLIFSDFGILNRNNYDLNGLNSLRTIVERALECSKININSINERYISTKFENGDALTLAGLSVQSENFVDEDGKYSSYADVLDGILQPLGLRLIQLGGVVYIYDLNGIITKKVSTSTVQWDGDDSSLGTDVVYNNICLTFSPYSDAETIKGELVYEDVYGPEWTNIGSGVKYYNGAVPEGLEAPYCYSYYCDYDESHRVDGWDYNLIDFTLFQSFNSEKCKGLAEIGSSFSYFKIQPMLGGTEKEGVIAGFYTGGHGPLSSGFPSRIGILNHLQKTVLKTNKAYLPKLSDNDRKLHYLRINLPLLYDVRYNPFQDASDANEGGNSDNFKSYAQFAFVPVSIVLYDENGNALYHYDNRTLVYRGCCANSVKYTAEDSYYNNWGWKSGGASWGDAWLSYYDAQDLIEGTGLNGWANNRQCFGKPWTDGSKAVNKRKYSYEDVYGNSQDFVIFDSFKKIPDGQFIPYPPCGGYIEVSIYNGIWVFDDTERFTTDETAGKFSSQGLYDKIRWQLYGIPSVTVVKSTLTLDDSEVEDVEYSGVVNVDAKEEPSIDRIWGTINGVSPTARGIYMKSSDGLQIQKMMRADRIDHPEQLLIGTLYSQYAERHSVLSGHIVLSNRTLTLYRDNAQLSNTKFIMVSEEQDIKGDTSDVVLIELSQDEYQNQ